MVVSCPWPWGETTDDPHTAVVQHSTVCGLESADQQADRLVGGAVRQHGQLPSNRHSRPHVVARRIRGAGQVVASSRARRSAPVVAVVVRECMAVV